MTAVVACLVVSLLEAVVLVSFFAGVSDKMVRIERHRIRSAVFMMQREEGSLLCDLRIPLAEKEIIRHRMEVLDKVRDAIMDGIA